MKTIKKASGLIMLTLLFTTAIAGYSQEVAPRTDKRQVAQRARIAEGRQDGEVTRREAAALHAQQRHIRRSERRAEADGDVTVREQRRLDRKQNRASRNIRRAKHNRLDND